MIDKNGNRFALDFGEDLGVISTDPTKLRQVLLNLLSNAAKFTNQGVVTLSVHRDRRAADWIEFAVKDTGIGIAESELPKLFNQFVQANATTQKNYGGTGIGLALSQRLAAMMGGGVTVTSEIGRGSCFTVRLPTELQASAEDEREAA
jgi:signal transduction histidine kinase